MGQTGRRDVQRFAFAGEPSAAARRTGNVNGEINMDFTVLIIPLLALGIWILGTVFGKAEEPARPPARRPEARRPPMPAPGAPSTDLDRFLDEARRRREAAERRAAPPAPAPTVTPTPSPRPVSPRTEAPRPTVRTSERRPPRPREAPRPEPTRREVRVEPTPMPTPTALVAEAIPVAEVVGDLTLTGVAAIATPAAAVARRPVSPAIAQVLGLLRSPRDARVAILLREILDPPLALRRGPRMR
jgi:hypothetical protein